MTNTVPNPRPKVGVFYTHFPHYRKPIFEKMSSSEIFDFKFFYDASGIDDSIANAHSEIHFTNLTVRKLGVFYFQFGILRQVWNNDFSACIFLGNPYVLTTWLAAALCKTRGVPILFWTHGWLRKEGNIKGVLRNIFYRLADGLLLYGNRAKRIGLEEGFVEDNLHVIYNSLDYEAQSKIRQNLVCEASENRVPYFLCVGRLVDNLELGLAIHAASILWKETQTPFELIIVGDGPRRDQLEIIAKDCPVKVSFVGSVYDETILGKYFLGCVAVISPGKVGLLAMHALAYGTKVITHDDFDYQMPEVEAIEDGVSGRFFKRHDVFDLSEKMKDLLEHRAAPEEHFTAIDRIKANYTPQRQLQLLEDILASYLPTSKP